MLAAVAAFWVLGLPDVFDLGSVIAHRDALLAFVATHPVQAALGFVLIYAACVSVSFPGASLLTLAGGFLFGTLWGGVLTVVAATAGASVVFLVARSSFAGGLAHKAGPFLARFAAGFERDAFLYLLAMRLAPIFPFWLVNLAPALVGVKLRDHILATAIGIIPGTFAFAAIGSGFDAVISNEAAAERACRAAGRPDCAAGVDLSALVAPELVVGLTVLALMALVPVLLRALRRGRSA
jgi:uncharacterized membrane protein YdjX (TVP38/TMEM64 family)